MLFPARSAPVGAGHITAPGITARSASAARPGKALAAGVKSVRHWDARQLLGEAIREALAVVGRVQDAIDVIEDRGLGDGVVGEMRTGCSVRGVGDVSMLFRPDSLSRNSR